MADPSQRWLAALAVSLVCADSLSAQEGPQSPLKSRNDSAQTNSAVRPLTPGNQAGDEWTNSLGVAFCWCPPGKFRMGQNDPSATDAQPVAVTLSRGFWMSKYEITQAQAKLLKADRLQPRNTGDLFPLHDATREQASKVAKQLTDLERKAGHLPSGWEYEVPTEAQWEYACRAGSQGRYAFGDDAAQLHRYANFADKTLLASDGSAAYADPTQSDGFGQALAPVGSFLPNAWGLHDLHGNVAEWCRDRYVPKLPGGTDPFADEKSADGGVFRGGAWCSSSVYCEAGFRNSQFLGKSREFLGVRIILQQK